MDTATASSRSAPASIAEGDRFIAVGTAGPSLWQVVGVVGARVLAERVAGADRRTFSARFVRERILGDEDGIDVQPID